MFNRVRDIYDEWFGPESLAAAHLIRFPIIYLVSAFGLRLKVYEMHTRTSEIRPHAIQRSNPEILEDVAPISEWNVNVLSPSGYRMLHAIAEHTHQCAMGCGILKSP
jgi:hypothetical protein